MKLLLVGINAKYIHSNLAIRCLKAACEKKGVTSEILLREYTINQNADEILSDLVCLNADLIAFSTYIFNIETVLRLVENLKIVQPNIRILLGGPEAGFKADELMKQYSEINYIITGEGERPFAKLAEELESEAVPNPANVPALSFRQGGEILHTQPLPLPREEHLPYQYSKADIQALTHRIIYFESSRGCPFRCAYCMSSIEKQLRFFELKEVLNQLSLFLTCRVPQVKFIDRTFNCNPKRALTIWRYISEHDNGVTNFHFEIAADLLSDEMIDCLAQMRPGLVQLEIGVQSTNPHTLEAIERKTDLELVQKRVQTILSKKNVHVHLDLIAGLPLEGYQSFVRSFNEVYRLKPHQLQLGFLKVLAGTPICQNAEWYGIRARRYPPYEVLKTNDISYEELDKLKQIEPLVDQLYNSGRFRHLLDAVLPLFESPFDFYSRLSAFLRESADPSIYAGKYGLYRAVLDYCARQRPETEAYLREMIKLDLFLRERARSLPEFLKLSITKQSNELLHHMKELFPEISDVKSCHFETFPEIAPGTWYCFDYTNRDLYSNARMLTASAKQE